LILSQDQTLIWNLLCLPTGSWQTAAASSKETTVSSCEIARIRTRDFLSRLARST